MTRPVITKTARAIEVLPDMEPVRSFPVHSRIALSQSRRAPSAWRPRCCPALWRRTLATPERPVCRWKTRSDLDAVCTLMTSHDDVVLKSRLSDRDAELRGHSPC